jgi:hypothetical protein
VLQAGKSEVRDSTRRVNFFNLLNPSGALGPVVHPACYRNGAHSLSLPVRDSMGPQGRIRRLAADTLEPGGRKQSAADGDSGYRASGSRSKGNADLSGTETRRAITALRPTSVSPAYGLAVISCTMMDTRRMWSPMTAVRSDQYDVMMQQIPRGFLQGLSPGCSVFSTDGASGRHKMVSQILRLMLCIAFSRTSLVR